MEIEELNPFHFETPRSAGHCLHYLNIRVGSFQNLNFSSLSANSFRKNGTHPRFVRLSFSDLISLKKITWKGYKIRRVKGNRGQVTKF